MQTRKKTSVFIPARLEQKYFNLRKFIICNKTEFATTKPKTYFTKCISKIEPSHINRGNTYVFNKKNPFKKAKCKNYFKKKPLCISPKSAKLQHNSLLEKEKNNVRFSTHLIQGEKNLRQKVRNFLLNQSVTYCCYIKT